MDTLLVQDCGRSLQKIFGDRAVAWLTGPENLKLRIGMLEHEETTRTDHDSTLRVNLESTDQVWFP